MRRIKRALSVTKTPKIEELADIHEHHEIEACNHNGTIDNRQMQSNNNKFFSGKISFDFIR